MMEKMQGVYCGYFCDSLPVFVWMVFLSGVWLDDTGDEYVDLINILSESASNWAVVLS
jgi:hypothetical protein